MLRLSCGMANIMKLALGVALLFVVETYSSSISIERDFSLPVRNSFDVYWNVASFMCKNFGYNFAEEMDKYGIIANKDDSFRGEKIVILYDPGLFPVMLKDTKTGKLQERNGGIPQLGNIDEHLKEFESVMEKVVPKDFSGVGVIDFEVWRPIFRQNWNDQTIYRNMTLELVRQKHPQWDEKQILQEAKKTFEAGAKEFMEKTLELAKKLRPQATWGYYGFPYCYNSGKEGSENCASLAYKENDELEWLFKDSTAYYPSLYISTKINDEEAKAFVTGRLNEAWRMAVKASRSNPPPSYPYVGYKFIDSSDLLSEKQLYSILETTRKYKMGGAIIWGSSNDLKTAEGCEKVFKYLQDTLGPVLLKVKANEEKAKKMRVQGTVKFNRIYAH